VFTVWKDRVLVTEENIKLQNFSGHGTPEDDHELWGGKDVDVDDCGLS
jgi:hypothetical protein